MQQFYSVTPPRDQNDLKDLFVFSVDQKKNYFINLLCEIQFFRGCMAASVILNEQLMKYYAVLLFALMLMNLVLEFTHLCIILCII